MLSSPNHAVRGMLYQYVMAEYFGLDAFKKRINESGVPEACRFEV